jgi:hypothetical protein
LHLKGKRSIYFKRKLLVLCIEIVQEYNSSTAGVKMKNVKEEKEVKSKPQ